ncbi:MAG: cytochrome P450 [Pseudomonadota bacterium]|nr:cytochrome P450 [Pseudomonadota bacterium]
MSETDRTPLGQIDMYDEELLECPFGFFRRLTREAPVLRHEASGVYQISGYELAAKALLDPETFSNEIGHTLHDRASASEEIRAAQAGAYPTASVLHTTDGAKHKFSRALVNRAFAPQRVREMEPRIEEIADALIDNFAARGSVEFMGEFAQSLPLMIIAEQMGVPPADIERFREWSDAFATRFSYKADAAAELQAAHAVVAFQQYFKNVLEEKKLRPTNDIISVIAGAIEEGADGENSLTMPQALQLCQQILVAGNESTAATLCEGMVLFLNRPELIGRIRDDADFRKNALEELLRVHSAVNAMWRVTTKKTEMGGVEIPEGALVLIRFGAANRDERTYQDADAYDPARANARRHIAFGFGVHVCIGASLARRELDICFRKLFSRLEGWRIQDGATLEHTPSIIMRALKELPLEFHPSSPRA